MRFFTMTRRRIPSSLSGLRMPLPFAGVVFSSFERADCGGYRLTRCQVRDRLRGLQIESAGKNHVSARNGPRDTGVVCGAAA